MLRQESSSECSPLQETKRSFFAHPGTPLTPISNRTSRKLPNSTGSRKQKGLKIATEVLRNRLENAGEVDFSRIVNDALEDLSAGVDHSFNEKNVRRRMYDTLNVLRAIGVIEKENGKLRWSGVLDKKSGESIEFDLRSPNDVSHDSNESICSSYLCLAFSTARSQKKSP